MTRLSMLAIALPCAALAGCTDADPTSTADPQAVATSVTATTAPIAAIASAMRPTGELDLAPRLAADDGGGADEGLARDSVEAGLTSGLVGNPSCVTLSWSGLTVSARFDHCTLFWTGQVLDGTIAATLTLVPLSVEFELQDVSVDTRSLDGSVGIRFGGENQPPLAVTADLAAAGPAGTVHLDQVSITGSPAGIVLDGGADVGSGSASARADATAMTWALGACLPSSGSLAIETGAVAATVTFLATTPGDGIVQVQVGTAPPANLPYFQPCGSE